MRSLRPRRVSKVLPSSSGRDGAVCIVARRLLSYGYARSSRLASGPVALRPTRSGLWRHALLLVLLTSLTAGCSDRALTSVLVVTVTAGDGHPQASSLRFRIGPVTRSVRTRFPVPHKDQLVVGLEGLPAEVSGAVSLVVEALDDQLCVLGRSSPASVRVEVGKSNTAAAQVDPLEGPGCETELGDGGMVGPSQIDAGSSGGTLDAGETRDAGAVGADVSRDTAPVCKTGEHACGSSCARDDSITQCGAACRRCSTPNGGSVICDGAQCVPSCPSGKRLCGDDCADNTAAPAMCPCPSGKHKCGEACADDALAASCGQRCQPCPAPANATATCTAGQCGFDCLAGFHRCGDQCRPDSDIGACGVDCRVCDFPQGGSATCEAGACKPACPSMRKLCNNACVATSAACNGMCSVPGQRMCPDAVCRLNDIDACGSMCTQCRAPAFGTATCDGSACGYNCNTDYRKCGNGCIHKDSCCMADDCMPPANATATCTTGICECACKATFVKCDSACISTSQCCNADSSIDINTNGVADCKENLLPNGQFKTNLLPWKADGAGQQEWSPMDARGSSSSGSIKVTNFYQSPDNGSVAGSIVCIPASAQTTYHAYADYLIPTGQPIAGAAAYEIVAYSQADCSTGFIVNMPLPDLGNVVGTWSRGAITFTTPANTRGLWVRLDAVKQAGNQSIVVHFDNVLLVR